MSALFSRSNGRNCIEGRFPFSSSINLRSSELSYQVYEALAYHVTQANFNRRVRTVSYWSLQKTISAALSALQSTMQPMSVLLQELKELEQFPDMRIP